MKYRWCYRIGHKWVYSFTSDFSERKELRACKRCGCIEEHRKNVPAYGDGWYLLVIRTKKGASKLLNRLRE